MNVYTVIKKWGLDEEIKISKYSRSNIKLMANDFCNVYSVRLKPQLGRFHQGINYSIQLVESNKKIEELTFPLLFYRNWNHYRESETTQMMPSGKKYYIMGLVATIAYKKDPRPYIIWKNYWSTNITNRIEYLNNTLPGIIDKLMKLEPLYENQAIYFYPWEYLVNIVKKEIKDLIIALSETELTKKITEKYTQDQYSLGPRLGPLGVKFSSDIAQHGVKDEPKYEVKIVFIIPQ